MELGKWVTNKESKQAVESKELPDDWRENIGVRSKRIRDLVIRGMGATDIQHTLGISKQQYRYSMRWMTKGHFRRNFEAYGRLLCSTQGRLEAIDDDIQQARKLGDFRAVAALHRCALQVEANLYDLGLKFGIFQKAADNVNIRASVGPMSREMAKLSDVDQNILIAVSTKVLEVSGKGSARCRRPVQFLIIAALQPASIFRLLVCTSLRSLPISPVPCRDWGYLVSS